MTKIQQKTVTINSGGGRQKAPFLDTLAQTRTDDNFPNLLPTLNAGDEPALLKKARRKYFTRRLVPHLAKCAEVRGDFKMASSYWNAYHCCSTLYLVDDKIVGKYCKCRWCLQCCAIRTAVTINKYEEVMQSWTDKQFVTLTEKNCDRFDLLSRIDEMTAIFKRMREAQRKRYKRGRSHFFLIGLRKIECTYNPIARTYNPHFHMIVETKEMADLIVKEWIRRNPLAKKPGQDIRPAREGSEKEIIKYETKMISTVANGRQILATPLDWIFTCVKGKRTFDRFGFNLKVEEEEGSVITSMPTGYYNWDKSYNDWIDEESGELLTGYKPSKGLIDLFDNNVVHHGYGTSPIKTDST